MVGEAGPRQGRCALASSDCGLAQCSVCVAFRNRSGFIWQVRLYMQVIAAAALKSGYSSCFALLLHQTMPPARYIKASRHALLGGLLIPEEKDFIVLKAF